MTVTNAVQLHGQHQRQTLHTKKIGSNSESKRNQRMAEYRLAHGCCALSDSRCCSPAVATDRERCDDDREDGERADFHLRRQFQLPHGRLVSGQLAVAVEGSLLAAKVQRTAQQEQRHAQSAQTENVQQATTRRRTRTPDNTNKTPQHTITNVSTRTMLRDLHQFVARVCSTDHK